MAVIKSPMLFFVTSPRTPTKMRSEIKLLVDKFAGKKWTGNTALQEEFMRLLARSPDFEGSYNQKNPALSARDRITRAPKALGFVTLDKISLTPAGAEFLNDETAEEALLRQLLKFQLPSPFHRENGKIEKSFCIRPYLEIIRLIYDLGRLAFDELMLFGMQLTDYREYASCLSNVRAFRIQKEKHRGRYKQFRKEVMCNVIKKNFSQEIAQGHLQTRESNRITLENFIRTKASNLRDYADACVRYLRATGLITISNPGRTLTIIETRREDVQYILKTVIRNPVFVDDEEGYCKHLYDATEPKLFTDDIAILKQRAKQVGVDLQMHDPCDLPLLKKEIRKHAEAQKKGIISSQITELKSFTHYDEVMAIFEEIKRKDVYDPSLALEWNTWRAMTMLDGGKIHANLTFDDAGNPLSTAPGKMSDIVCDYDDFLVSVEVTLMSGSKQYDAEGEPVARHLGDLKRKSGKAAYGFFIAPMINESIIPYFFMLQKTPIRHYGGKSVIVPLSLERFMGMVRQVRDAGAIPEALKIKEFFEYAERTAQQAEDEQAWYEAVCSKADNWLC